MNRESVNGFDEEKTIISEQNLISLCGQVEQTTYPVIIYQNIQAKKKKKYTAISKTKSLIDSLLAI